MLDIQFIRDNAESVQQKSIQKGYDVDVPQLIELDSERRTRLTQVEELRRRRNEQAAELQNQRPSEDQIAAGRQLKEELSQRELELKSIETKYIELLKSIPNMPLEDVPIGTNENDNVVSKVVGDPTHFDFEPLNHWQIGESKGWIDKERASKVSGSRFAYIKGDLVILWQALISYATSKLTDENFIKQIVTDNNLQLSTKPFIPVLPPLLIKTELYDAMDRLEPRDDRYKIESEELWLQGSAEHVLGSMHANETINYSELPLRYVGLATSFRKEAGTYGKDTEGIFRMHQFDKLEMESLTDQESSLDEHYLMIAIQEYFMQSLGLPYRVLNKCTADIGKPNAHGVDIDVWLPGQNKYRETHTADYMTDYQARRLQTRYRTHDNSIKLVHTNDATAFAQRPLIGIIENYQTREGNVVVPEVLRPYFNGRTEI